MKVSQKVGPKLFLIYHKLSLKLMIFNNRKVELDWKMTVVSVEFSEKFENITVIAKLPPTLSENILFLFLCCLKIVKSSKGVRVNLKFKVLA